MSSRERDCHHLAHDRISWSARSQGLDIRNNSSMIARRMPRAEHELLHFMTAPVPVPGFHTLKYVAERLPSGLDVISGIDTYSSLVEESSRHPKAKYVERRLAELSIEAMRGQIPYLRELLPSKRRIIA